MCAHANTLPMQKSYNHTGTNPEGGSESGVDLEGIGANISEAGELGSMHMHSPPAEAMGYYSAWLIFFSTKVPYEYKI